MMQPKGESDTAKELSFAKRFPCQSIKTSHKNKKVQTSYPASDRLRDVRELQKDLVTELAPMEASLASRGNTKEGCYVYSILGKGSTITWSHTREIFYQL